MEAIYHWVGFAVVWATILAAVWFGGGWLASWVYKRLPRWPWLLWTMWYLMRAVGKHRKPKNSFGPPFYFNDGSNRAYTKKNMATERALQANLARYNRRRWQAMC